MSLLFLIIKNLFRQRVRSLLTALGIGLGIAVIVALFTLTASMVSDFSASLESGESDILVAQKNVADLALSSIDEKYVEQIEGLEGVEKARGVLLAFPRFEKAAFFVLYGENPEDSGREYRIVEGRLIKAEGEIMVGKIAAENFDLALGDKMRFGSSTELGVVGVYEKGIALDDGAGVTTLADAQGIMELKGKVSLIGVKLDFGADADATAEKIEQMIPSVLATRSDKFLETQSDFESLDAFNLVFSVVAIIFGAVVVLNTMVMSIFERIREIGVLRAVGWTRTRVLAMILGESAILGILGFLIGSFLGVVAVFVLTSLPAVRGFISFSLDPAVFLSAFEIGFATGVLGGIFPALKALKITPLEALGYE
ncbi:MAG: ABC transporter permease [Patescibacteria group bacterium]|nr:MAG: ABC transporter permease [Patescibacteria group bacterium]